MSIMGRFLGCAFRLSPSFLFIVPQFCVIQEPDGPLEASCRQFVFSFGVHSVSLAVLVSTNFFNLVVSVLPASLGRWQSKHRVCFALAKNKRMHLKRWLALEING